MSMNDVLKAGGVNVEAAKAALVKLDATFGGQHGDIPEGALRAWVDAHFTGKAHGVFLALGRAWEKEHAATLPKDRQDERALSSDEWAKRRDKKKA